jgi:uncharacterized protein (UPF0332 family)
MSPDQSMAKALRAIASAKLLLADGDLEGAINRAYYAMFDASHAALAWSGAQANPAATKTHRGLISAVGQYLVKPGVFPVEFGRSLNRVERLRLLGDYSGETVEAGQAVRAVEEAEAFVLAVRRKWASNPSMTEDKNGPVS